MSNLNKVAIGVIVALLLVVAGLLMTQVGGKAIRSASLTYEIGVLRLTSNTLLPGAPMTVMVSTGLSGWKQSSVLLLRMPMGSVTVSDVEPDSLEEGTLRVTVPCESGGQPAAGATTRLILIDHDTQAVLAQSDQLKLLPPGPDCLFTQ